MAVDRAMARRRSFLLKLSDALEKASTVNRKCIYILRDKPEPVLSGQESMF